MKLKKIITLLLLIIALFVTCVNTSTSYAAQKPNIKITVIGATNKKMTKITFKITNKSKKNIKISNQLNFNECKTVYYYDAFKNLKETGTSSKQAVYKGKSKTIKPNKSIIVTYTNKIGGIDLDGNTYFETDITYNKKSYWYNYYPKSKEGFFE